MKSLVLYFSNTGNTRSIAELIYQNTFSNIEEIRMINDDIKPIKSDIYKYDVIYVGSPIIDKKLSKAIKALFSKYNFDLKRVIPFISYDNRGYDNIKEELLELCPNIEIKSLLEVYWDDISLRDLNDWFSKIKS